ncbi:Farnesol dehydrogenase, partial [Frankliniella fusca]
PWPGRHPSCGRAEPERQCPSSPHEDRAGKATPRLQETSTAAGMDRFAGRVAVVTGASCGIGAQIAEQFVKAGILVVGVARREQLLTELAARLEGEKGKLYPVAADLTREEDIRRLYEWVDDNLGGVSVVVNNAGMLTLTPLQDLDAATVQNVVSLNLTGVMLSCREAILSMKKHGIKDGHIININSVAGHFIHNYQPLSTSVYAPAKHGITALCKALRYDVQALEGYKIRVTSVSPGAVATEMLPKEYTSSMKEILQPQDVADAVCYVLSCPPSVEIAELTIRPTGEKA